MISEAEYRKAVESNKVSQDTINQYHREKSEAFEMRLKDNPVFTDEELFYSAVTLCPCGHGLAYPKDCGPFHYWDCSAILRGDADKGTMHTGRLAFSFYDIKGESENRGSTRGVFKPKLENDQSVDCAVEKVLPQP